MVPRGLAALIQLVVQARAGESQGDVWWTSNLWTVVASIVRRGELAPGLVTVLEAHGNGGGDPARARVPDNRRPVDAGCAERVCSRLQSRS